MDINPTNTIIVLGIVEFSRRLGLDGKILLIISVAVGLLVSIVTDTAKSPPHTYQDWVLVVAAGLVYAFSASGIANGANRIGKKYASTNDPNS